MTAEKNRKPRRSRSEVESKFDRLIGAFLRDCRHEALIFMRPLAERIGLCDDAHFAKIERGETSLSLFRFFAIANVFGITGTELMVRFTVWAAERGVSVDSISELALDFMRVPEWELIVEKPTDPL